MIISRVFFAGLFAFSLSLESYAEDGVTPDADSLPTYDEASEYARPWNEGLCGTPEEFMRRLNVLNDTLICSGSSNMLECAGLIGGLGAGSIAAIRAARASAAMEGARPDLCRIGSVIDEGIFTSPFTAGNWELIARVLEFVIDPALANRSCIAREEMFASQARNYFNRGAGQLDAAFARERDAMEAFLSGADGVNFRANPPTDVASFNRYVENLRGAVMADDANMIFGDADDRVRVMEFLEGRVASWGELTDDAVAQNFRSLRFDLSGFFPDESLGPLEETMANRGLATRTEAFEGIADILRSNGPSSAPYALSSESTRRIDAFRAEFPQYADDLDAMLEARGTRTIAFHQRALYQERARLLNNPTTRTRYMNNPNAVIEMLGEVRHFNFSGGAGQHDRFRLSSAAHNLTTPGQYGQVRNAGIRIPHSTWEGPNLGRLSMGRRALVTGGTRLAASVGLGIVTAGTSMAADVGIQVLTPTRAACATLQSQFRVTDEGGCGNFVDISHPTTQEFIGLPIEFAMRQAQDDPGLCDVVNQLYSEHSGPENFSAECLGGSGFRLNSRGGNSDYHVIYGDEVGQVAQIFQEGDGALEHGGNLGYFFQDGSLSEVRSPGVPAVWMPAMMDNPDQARRYAVEGTYETTPINVIQDPNNGGVNRNNAVIGIGSLSMNQATLAEVGACCSGQGSPGEERCGAYGIRPGDVSTDPVGEDI